MYSEDLQNKTNSMLFMITTTIIVAFVINIISNQIYSSQQPDSVISKFIFLLLSLILITFFLIIVYLVFNYHIKERTKSITPIILVNSENGSLTEFPFIYTQMILRQTINSINDHRQNILFRLSPSIILGDPENINYRIRQNILGRNNDDVLLDIATALILDQIFLHVSLLDRNSEPISENSDTFNELNKNSIISNLLKIVQYRGIPGNTLTSVLQPRIPKGFDLKINPVNPDYNDTKRITMENRWVKLTIDCFIGLKWRINRFDSKYYPMVGNIPIESSEVDNAYELFKRGAIQMITLNYSIELKLKNGRLFFGLITFFRGKFRKENLKLMQEIESIYENLENNPLGDIDYDFSEHQFDAHDKYLLDTLRKINVKLFNSSA